MFSSDLYPGKQRVRVKQRKRERGWVNNLVHLRISGNSKPHLRNVPSRKSLSYLVRILLETSSERSWEGKDTAEGGDLSGGFTFARQLTTGHLWPSYFIQSHSAHLPPPLPPYWKRKHAWNHGSLFSREQEREEEKWRIRPLIPNGSSLLMKQFRSGHSVGFCQVAQAGSVLINNIGWSFQDYANGSGAQLEAGRKETKGLALTFHMQSHARVSAAGPLDRKHHRFPQAGRRIIAQKQAH